MNLRYTARYPATKIACLDVVKPAARIQLTFQVSASVQQAALGVKLLQVYVVVQQAALRRIDMCTALHYSAIVHIS
jgi:hypothetical protein